MAAKKNNIFVKAKAYQKLHPKTAWATCIQKCKGKKTVSGTKTKKIASPAKVGKVRKKRTTVSKVKTVRVPGKKTSTLQKGRVLVRRIEALELKRKAEKAREIKDLMQIEINACHDRLDALKRHNKRKSA